MFVNTRNPYMFRSFLFDHPQGAVSRALCRYDNVFRWFAFVECLLGMWPYVYIICLCVCVCVCVLGALVSGRSVCELFRNVCGSTTTESDRWADASVNYTTTASEGPTLQRTRVAAIILLWISKTVIHEKGLLQVVCIAFTSRWKVYYKSADLGVSRPVFFLPDSMHQVVCPDTPHRQQNHQEPGDIHHNGNQIQSLLVHSQFLICVPHDSNQELQQSTNIFRNIQ
jgi:hypothetical protein